MIANRWLSAVMVVCVLAGGAEADRPCPSSCWREGCPKPSGGHVPPCPAGDGPVQDVVRKWKCPNGMTKQRGICCWHGQSVSGDQCVGWPNRCPNGMLKRHDGCSAACAANEYVTVDQRCESRPSNEPGFVVIDSNLSGALAQNLAPDAAGYYLPAGTLRVRQPPGRYLLRFSFASTHIAPYDVTIEVKSGQETPVRIDWRAQNRSAVLAKEWTEFAASDRTADAWVAKGGIGAGIGIGLVFTISAAVLFGTCGANVNGSCSADWQKGLAYTGGIILALGGVAALGLGFGSITESRRKRATPLFNLAGQPITP